MTAGARLDPERDLDIALATATETNRVIAAADIKAGLVLAAQGVVLAAVASGVRAGPVMSGPTRAAAVAAAVLACVAAFLLAGTLWPRTRAPARTWFAFPALRMADLPSARPCSSELAEQAWAQAEALAAIARRKYRWFRAGLAGGTAAVLALTVWIALVAST